MDKDIVNIFEELGLNECDYFLTGSRALDNEGVGFKISKEESDYDIVVTIHARHLIINYLHAKEININYSCYNGGFRFILEGKQYNILTFNDIEFMAWRESLHILQHLIVTSPLYMKAIGDKRTRYCLYEQLRGLCKTAITLDQFIKGN